MKKLPLLIVGGLTLAGVAAFAAPQMGRPAKGDTDGNGLVSKAEALAMVDKHFAKMDGNSDGKIDAGDREAMRKKHFEMMDADKNGSISEAEFAAAHAARMEKREDRREQRMGKGEAGGHGGGKHHGRGGRGGAMMVMLHKADVDGDKAVTREEARTSVEAHFAKVDTNKDGNLSADERQAARKAMREEMGKARQKAS
jgi:Ca2+-binding EF-hand superfamily protein